MSGALQMKKQLFLIAPREISPVQKKRTEKRMVAIKAKASKEPELPKSSVARSTQILLPPEEVGYIKVGKYDMY